MTSAFLLPEILARKFRSVGWINRVEIPKVVFDHEARLELFASEIWDIAERILMATGVQYGTESIPICHVTLENGSEQDLYVHLVQQDATVVFLEVSHSYVDQHFLQFQLWDTDRNKAREYPIDELFQQEAIEERGPDGAKVAEVFVKPTQLTIHTSHFEPLPHLPSQDKLAALEREVTTFPTFTFWRQFERGQYDQAADALERELHPAGAHETNTDTHQLFLQALYATCKYWAKDFITASRWFLSATEGYLGQRLDRIADMCVFFAIEAGKRVPDKNAALVIADQIVRQLSFLTADNRTEVTGILRSYYSDVYVGTAVLCRRLIELRVSDLLLDKHGKTASIKDLIKGGKASGKIPKDTGPGLFAILALALADGALTPSEHEIATHIKDFGNNIHDKGRVQNEVDAKYAIQSCIHLLHRK